MRSFQPHCYWPIYRQHPDLELPDGWGSLQSFVDWWMGNGRPMLIPHDAGVVQTDDATAISIFRRGQFQVELYLIHPNKVVPWHSHPHMEVVTMIMGGGGVHGEANPVFGTSDGAGQSSYLFEGQSHGGTGMAAAGGGYMLLSFERWLADVKPTSAAIQWEGPTAGPIHDALLAL